MEIRGLSADSRRVEPGFLFAALPGSRTDGLSYLDEALKRGAVAVLVPEGTPQSAVPPSLAIIRATNPRRRFAELAARFYGRQPLCIAAVTGTNGKSSVVSFLRQIWAEEGLGAGSLGTLGLSAPDLDRPGSLTTPDPVALHATLAELAANGVDYLAMEASSHGLDQHRLDGVAVTAAAFTNLTRDHLDYHGTLEAYFAAKVRLFSEVLRDDGVAVVNVDDPQAQRVLEVVGRRGLKRVTVGRAGEDVRLLAAEADDKGQRLRLRVSGVEMVTHVPLPGDFQVANALVAAGLAIATGVTAARAVAALARLRPVPGRLERVASVQGGTIYVDYAHTPDALAAALAALRPLCCGRLWLVFGCGGDRDAGKRPEMGAIAAQRADRIVITDDNPRSEPAAAIRAAILAACPGAMEIGDRRAAIAHAIAALAPGDVLLVAGKGHEGGQIVGAQVLPFDDRAVIAELAQGRAA